MAVYAHFHRTTTTQTAPLNLLSGSARSTPSEGNARSVASCAYHRKGEKKLGNRHEIRDYNPIRRRPSAPRACTTTCSSVPWVSTRPAPGADVQAFCGGFSRPFDSLDFHKDCSPTNPVRLRLRRASTLDYRRCRDCGFIFTGFFNNWTPDEFATYVYNADYPRINSEHADIPAGNVAPAAVPGRPSSAPRRRHRHPRLRLRPAFAERVAGHGFANVTNYDAFSSPARPAGQFSLVTCFEVIEHTVSPRACLQDMASFLAPGGCIVISRTCGCHLT